MQAGARPATPALPDCPFPRLVLTHQALQQEVVVGAVKLRDPSWAARVLTQGPAGVPDIASCLGLGLSQGLPVAAAAASSPAMAAMLAAVAAPTRGGCQSSQLPSPAPPFVVGGHAGGTLGLPLPPGKAVFAGGWELWGGVGQAFPPAMILLPNSLDPGFHIGAVGMETPHAAHVARQHSGQAISATLHVMKQKP
jgi:hypothetical protein